MNYKLAFDVLKFFIEFVMICYPLMFITLYLAALFCVKVMPKKNSSSTVIVNEVHADFKKVWNVMKSLCPKHKKTKKKKSRKK